MEEAYYFQNDLMLIYLEIHLFDMGGFEVKLWQWRFLLGILRGRSHFHYRQLYGLQIYMSMAIKLLFVNMQEVVLPLCLASRYLSTQMMPSMVFLLMMCTPGNMRLTI